MKKRWDKENPPFYTHTQMSVPYYRAQDKKTNCVKVWNTSLGLLSALVVASVAAVAIATIVLTSQGESLQRYCINNCISDTFCGQFAVNSNDRTVEWDLQHTLPMGDPVLSLQIRGPIPPGLTEGPLFLAICGVPSTLACDTAVSGVLKGKLTETYQGNSLKTTINSIRGSPRRYYLELGTAMNTTGLTAPLGTLCGTTG